MSLKFGTSGVRGLAEELTDGVCAHFAQAFMRRYRQVMASGEVPQDAPPIQGQCLIAGDLRSSTPRMLAAIARGLRAEGFEPVMGGVVPTPALAFACSEKGLPGIMVTGSHIPADRNGIKFYYPWGEILKNDEGPLFSEFEGFESSEDGDWQRASAATDAVDLESAYLKRYVDAFGTQALAGKVILFYEHSSAARDVAPRILEAMGATVIRYARSESFVPVDTEALTSVQKLSEEVARNNAFALLSTDGDADRPLLLDERGNVVRGDVLGILVARALAADSVATPVSSSTALEMTGEFSDIRRTKIGSPYVVAALNEALLAGKQRVMGFEANGGFLLASHLPAPVMKGVSAELSGLDVLPTRDALLPALVVLIEATRQQIGVSQLVSTLPARFTVSDLIRDFELERSSVLLQQMVSGGVDYFEKHWVERIGRVQNIDTLDGVRVSFVTSEILHFRPSGNAPEFRIYSEAISEDRAAEINRWARDWVESVS